MGVSSTVGIIGGNGWIGSAIANSVVLADVLAPDRLILSSRSEARQQVKVKGVEWTTDNNELASRSDVIIVSVRPEQFQDVCIDAGGKLVISVMAGVPVEALRQQTKASRVIRALPNAAASIQRSFTPWYACDAVSGDDKHAAHALLGACGTSVEVALEKYIDYFVVMTGSGAAFPALLASALIANAVEFGLPPDLARRAAKSVLADATQLLADADADPAEIIRTMIEYRGITAVGLQSMIDHGFYQAVAAGLDDAVAKAQA